MQSILLAAILAVPQGPGSSTAPVVINEFVYNDSGTDDREFVELYNRTNSPVDISNWVIDAFSVPGTTPNIAYTIPGGTMLAPGGFYLIGSSTNSHLPAFVPDLDLATMGPNSNGTDLWENGTDSLTLLDASGSVVDSVIYTAAGGIWGTNIAEGDGLHGQYFSPDSTQLSLSRLIDGFDNDDNGRDFFQLTATPGAPNGVVQSNFPFNDNFDGRMVGDTLSEFAESFVALNVIDPTMLAGNNPRIIPASPQGGNAIIVHDPTGGGNSNYLLANALPQTDVVFEAYAYFVGPFDTSLASSTSIDSEAWAVGVRGTTDEFGHPHDMPGNYYARTRFYTPGGTGIAWAHFRTNTYSRLFLADLGNGGIDFQIIGSIDIVPNVNDGWQRIRIHAQGDRIVGNFGGTYGLDDGIRFTARTTTVEPGSVWTAYREFLWDNSLWQPLVLDAVDIRNPTTQIQFVGTSLATTVGTPAIDADGLAILGSNALQILGSDLVPNGSLVGLLLGTSFNNPPVPVPNAPPGATLIVNQLASNLGFSNSSGEVAFPLPIPNQPALSGLQVTSQLVDIDPALMFPLPIGHSQGMGLTVGN